MLSIVAGSNNSLPAIGSDPDVHLKTCSMEWRCLVAKTFSSTGENWTPINFQLDKVGDLFLFDCSILSFTKKHSEGENQDQRILHEKHWGVGFSG